MFITKIWRSVAGQLSDRPKIFEGQNKNLPVLSDSPAVFAKAVLGQTGLSKQHSTRSDAVYTLYIEKPYIYNKCWFDLAKCLKISSTF